MNYTAKQLSFFFFFFDCDICLNWLIISVSLPNQMKFYARLLHGTHKFLIIKATKLANFGRCSVQDLF